MGSWHWPIIWSYGSFRFQSNFGLAQEIEFVISIWEKGMLFSGVWFWPVGWFFWLPSSLPSLPSLPPLHIFNILEKPLEEDWNEYTIATSINEMTAAILITMISWSVFTIPWKFPWDRLSCNFCNNVKATNQVRFHIFGWWWGLNAYKHCGVLVFNSGLKMSNKSRQDKTKTPAQTTAPPPTSNDIIPGRFTEADWYVVMLNELFFFLMYDRFSPT